MHKDDARLDESATAAREIDRRTIAKGVAWTVPVVIVATAAPAAAASRGSTSLVTPTVTHGDSIGNGTSTFTVRRSPDSAVDRHGDHHSASTTDGSATPLVDAQRPLPQLHELSFTADRRASDTVGRRDHHDVQRQRRLRRRRPG